MLDFFFLLLYADQKSLGQVEVVPVLAVVVVVVVDRENHDYDVFVVALWTFLKYT
jgi:hypothetical protein